LSFLGDLLKSLAKKPLPSALTFSAYMSVAIPASSSTRLTLTFFSSFLVSAAASAGVSVVDASTGTSAGVPSTVVVALAGV
jgi:hypothetical protein